MEKFIPYEKLSKKEKRKIDLAKRQTWGELNPVTRKPENSKAYNRKRTQDWKKEFPELRPFITSEPEFEHYFGKRSDKKRKFYNGKIQCNYYMYTGGSKKPVKK